MERPKKSYKGLGRIKTPKGCTRGPDGRFLCPKMNCTKRFLNCSSLYYHLAQQHSGKFKHWCDACQKGFSRTSHYEDHMAAKHKGIIHSCNLCEKLFTSRRGRDLHMNTHTGIYPFSCLVCRRGFNYKKHLQAHEKSKHGGSQEISSKLFNCSSFLHQTFGWIVFYRKQLSP